MIYDEVTIPRKSLIDQPRYQTHTREQKLIFQVLSANTGSSGLINFDNLDFYANIGQAELALLSRSMSHDMRHVT